MATKLRSPTCIAEIVQRDPGLLAAALVLAADVRRAQKSYFANRSAPNALELLAASKDLERRFDQAIDGLCAGSQQGLAL